MSKVKVTVTIWTLYFIFLKFIKSMHAIATSLIGYMYTTIVHAWLKYFCPRSKVKVTRSKPKFFWRFVSSRNPLNELTFFNQANTKHVSNDGHGTRTKCGSKVKVTGSYYEKIGHAAFMVFYAICAWSSLHCHTRQLPGMCTHDHHPLILQRDEGQLSSEIRSRKLIFGKRVC